MEHKPSNFGEILMGVSLGMIFRVAVDVLTKGPGIEDGLFWLVMSWVPVVFAGVIYLCEWLNERP